MKPLTKNDRRYIAARIYKTLGIMQISIHYYLYNEINFPNNLDGCRDIIDAILTLGGYERTIDVFSKKG